MATKAPATLNVSSVYDFCDRTLAIAPDAKFGLELKSLYEIYEIYCETLGLQICSFATFLDEVRRAFPHSFKMVKTAHRRLGDVPVLLGINYIRPRPWTDTKRKRKYLIEGTTTGNIEQINRKLSNEELPTGIPEYWPDFAKLVRIKSGNKIVIFTPYDYQTKLWELMEENNKLKIVKSRQLGITQTIISVFLHRACLNPAYTAVVFLRHQGDTTKIAWRNREMVNSLYNYITNLSDSTRYFKIKGGGDIHFMNASVGGSRSIDSVSDFMYDEAAFVDQIEEIVSGSGASSAMVGKDSTQVILSTPNTAYGWFHRQFTEKNPDGFDFEATCKAVINQTLDPFYVWDGTDTSKKVIIHWRAHPVYKLRDDFVEWRAKIDEISMEKAEREYNLLFQNSEITVFSYADVAACMNGAYELEPEVGANYYMGIDTAWTGRDYTVAYVAKEYKVPNPAAEPGSGQQLNAYKIVAEYRASTNLHGVDMRHIADLVRKWKPRIVGVETFEGTGAITSQKLVALFPELMVINIKSIDSAKAYEVSLLKSALAERRINFPPGPLSGELAVFSIIDGKFMAPSGAHDDCVAAAMMLLTVTPYNEGDFRLITEIPVDQSQTLDVTPEVIIDLRDDS